jgi:hypothetical protein
LGIPCAASAWNGEEFALHRDLAGRARSEGAAPMALCFAIVTFAASSKKQPPAVAAAA